MFGTCWVSCFDYYGEDAGPTSSKFSVKLKNNGKEYTPHVYGIAAPSWAGNKNKANSNSWVEFEHDDDDTTSITVTKLNGDFPSNVHLRPLSYNIPFKVTKSNEITFSVTGHLYHTISVHYGSDTTNNDENSAIVNTMLIFITPPINYDSVANMQHIQSMHNVKNIKSAHAQNTENSKNSKNVRKSTKFKTRPKASNGNKIKRDRPVESNGVKVFESGKVYHLEDGGYPSGTGVYVVNNSLNSNIDTIIVERGAWIYGKIYIDKDNVNLYGPGIICGEKFDYEQRKNGTWNQEQMMFSTNRRDNINVTGITVVTPNFRLFDYITGYLSYFRGIGWSPNNGQGHLEPGSVELNSFVRAYDDCIKAAENVKTYNMVIWQGYNGASFQFGWNGYDIQKSVEHYNANIIANEYETPTEWDGDNTRSNNALISCVNPSGAQMNGPFKWYNLNVDGTARILMLLSLNDNGYLRNLYFYGLKVSGPIEWFNGMYTQQYSAEISDIHFYDFSIDGKNITNLWDNQFKFHYSGNVDVNSFTFES